ncbi:MAG: RDD family protein, partial [Xanthobacteraceae bacterium]
MSNTGPGGFGASSEVRPHAYDPVNNPELFEGVLAKRVVAFAIDVVVIAVPVALAALFILVLGFITFGLGWILFWLWWPAAVIWALVYYGATLGSEFSATIGMRVMEI